MLQTFSRLIIICVVLGFLRKIVPSAGFVCTNSFASIHGLLSAKFAVMHDQVYCTVRPSKQHLKWRPPDAAELSYHV